MSLLQVEIADFVEAAEVLHDHVGDPVSLAIGRLTSALSGCGGMAGDDPGGRDWAHVYDRAARSTLRATGQVVSAAFTTAAMFGRSAMNYADAETASTTSGSQRPATSAQLQRLPATSFVGPPRMPPAADGGSSDPPTGWWLIQHTVGYVWPSGHQDQLHRAAAAWSASAAALDDAAFETFRAGTLFNADHLPEAGDIGVVTRGLSDHLSDLAAAHRGLADACTDLAHHIDECHSAVEHELVELLAWTAGIQTVGAIASVFTLGVAEAPTQAAKAAKIAQTAGIVGSLIAKCLTAARTVATTIAPIVLASDRLAAVLEMLATSKLAASAASAVPGVLRTAKTGTKGVSLVKKARSEITATRRIASKGRLVPRAPALGRASEFKPPPIYRDRHGRLTNGEFSVSPTDMARHTSGSLAKGKSQFFHNVDADKAVLDAASYARRHGLIFRGRAKVYVENGPVGVHGTTGLPTHWINVYVSRTGTIHGAPGGPP